ncbi:MAG TPA: class I SAM-dependent methyltransferase [Candidatus Sulfotelmatobacter sp.]|nr:class I SAM-dependent methyltransferase [Candidatus Sulfotelmatobacter sp.]
MASQACRICGGAAAHRVVAREMMFGTRERFDYVECADCGCLQIAAIPADLARFYPSAYHGRVAGLDHGGPVKRWARRVVAGPILAVAPGLARRHPALAHYARFLAPYRRLGIGPRDRILDVGAGGGQHVAALRAFGFAGARGVDRFIAADVRDRRGELLVRRGDVADADADAGFALIELNHSLEHMPDQADTLARCRALLAPGGMIRVRVPTVSSEAWARYGADWVQLDAPRHLYLHSHRSLAVAAAKAGLAVASLACDSTAFQFWGSEQYRRDVALDAPTSYAVDPAASIFTPADIARFEAEALQLNAAQRGDQIDVVLRVMA